MMGRVNLFKEMLAAYPDKDAAWIQSEIDSYHAQADAFEQPSRAPYWSAQMFPSTRFIPNDTTLIVIADQGVASAGEGLLSYLYRQVENVVLVGENSRGAVTFGQVSTHQLPHSKLRAVLPIKLNAQLDLEWREERGYSPDLWVPAGDALNCAVAAARKGTITTRRDLPEGYFDAEFVPEKPLRRNWISENRDLIALSFLAIAVINLAYVNRKRIAFFIISAICWLSLGVGLLPRKPAVGYVLVILGSAHLLIGLYKWRKTREQWYKGDDV